MTQEQIERIILVEVLDFKKPERAGEHCRALARTAAQKIMELGAAPENPESFKLLLGKN
jgi:hypothetical protein